MRILVVDHEYFIAMEVERVLQVSGEHEIQIAMPWEFARVLQEQPFDLLLIDSSLISQGGYGDLLKASGASLIFLSLRRHERNGLPDWPGVPVVPKPFTDEQVLDAAKDAARNRAAS